MEHHKSKKLCITKETITQVKRKTTEWERTFANHTSDRGLSSRKYNDSPPKNYDRFKQ